jgi:hypothetical protein
MRLLGTISAFAFTMFMALFIFTYMLFQTPQTLRSLLDSADAFRYTVLSSGVVPDQYSVWFQVLLQANQIVLVGISIAVRIAIAILGSIVTRWNEGPQRDVPRTEMAATPAASSSKSPFSRWG